MPAEVVNSSITGALLSANIFLGNTVNMILVALFGCAIAILLLYVLFSRYKK